MPQRRVTIRDIAKKAGVGIATASRALNNEPDVKQCTRELVLKIAGELGYKKDAMLTALAQTRWNKPVTTIQQSIAWINCWSNHSAPHSNFPGGLYELFFEGAKTQAAKMGYRLETYKARDEGLSDQRLTQILETKGTLGVIIGPAPTKPKDLGGVWGDRCELNLNWKNFCAVRIGYSYNAHPFNVVISAQFKCVSLAVRSLVGLGYRKIGYITSRNEILRTRGHFVGAFEYCKILNSDGTAHLSTYISDDEIDSSQYPEIKKWFADNGIEAIVGTNYQSMDIALELGFSIPENMGYVHIGGGVGERDVAQINQNGKLIGENCINVIHSMIANNEKGVPPTPRETIIHPKWEIGNSVREIGSGPR